MEPEPEAMLGFVDPVRVKTLVRGREYVRDLFTCSVCGSLVEEDYRLAHVAWHETLRASSPSPGEGDPSPSPALSSSRTPTQKEPES